MIDTDGARLGAQAARELAASRQCEIGPGMTERELRRVEQEYGFEFADDHRAFLAAGLPVNTPIPEQEGVIHAYARPWPDWRDGTPEELRRRLAWPVEGVLFDVEHNAFWDRDWGVRPDEQAEALHVAAQRLATVPRMVPIYGHRFLPGGHGTYGHPVLSMYQTDIIYYGTDLADYISREFGGRGAVPDGALQQAHATVPFWRDFL